MAIQEVFGNIGERNLVATRVRVTLTDDRNIHT